MREPVEKIIDGEQYTFCQLPAKKSLKLLTRLTRIVGPSLGAALGTSSEGAVGIKAMLDRHLDLGAVVAALCDRLEENEVEAIVDTLLSQVIHAGQGEVSQKFDVLFAGRLPHLFKVLGAALQLEYGDFLAGGGVTAALAKVGRTAMTRGSSI
jgi:hypothetical protein